MEARFHEEPEGRLVFDVYRDGLHVETIEAKGALRAWWAEVKKHIATHPQVQES